MKTRTLRSRARAKGHRAAEPDALYELLLEYLPRLCKRPLPQTVIPKLAKDATAVREIENLLKKIPTRHELYLGDACDMAAVKDESVHLAVTSPPYRTLKVYPSNEAQFGGVSDYDTFLKELHSGAAGDRQLSIRRHASE